MISLAHEIGQLLGEININVDAGRDMPADEQRIVTARLLTLGKLAANMEHELSVLRLIEGGRIGRATVEQLASESLVDLSLFTGAGKGPSPYSGAGTIVRPDFGGKK